MEAAEETIIPSFRGASDKKFLLALAQPILVFDLRGRSSESGIVRLTLCALQPLLILVN
jgi:hypothetical protein